MSGTIDDIAAIIKNCLGALSGQAFVIFDQRNGVSAKDHEHVRRAGDGATAYHLSLNSPLPQWKDVMGNNENKRQLIHLLCTFNIGERVELESRQDCMVTHDEADISLMSYMLHTLGQGAHRVQILCDDTDVFVLIVYWCWKSHIKAEIQFQKRDNTTLRVNDTVSLVGPI